MSRKRKLEAIHRHDDEDSNCNISLAKRRKLNSITIATSNIKDSNQCASIYETINDSSLIKQLQIPEVILKQISEYTTVKCDNFSKCHNELSALNQHKLYKEQTNGYCNNNDDIEIESRDYFYNKPYDDKDLNKDIQIFCNDCSKQLKQCDMNAENWYESWNGFKYQYDYDEEEYCSKRFMDYETCQCNNTFRTCDNHRSFCEICQSHICWDSCDRGFYHENTKCKDCKKEICTSGSGVLYCHYCREYVCSNCIEKICDCEYDTQWSGFINISCFVHKECNVDHSKYLVVCQCNDNCNQMMCLFCNCRSIYPEWLSCLKCGKDGDTKVYNLNHIEDSKWFYCDGCERLCAHMICDKCDDGIVEFEEEVGCHYCGTVCNHEFIDE
eukprot:446838_1